MNAPRSRWADDGEATGLEGLAGELARQARASEELSSAARARVLGRLGAQRPATFSWFRMFALVGGVGSAALAASQLWPSQAGVPKVMTESAVSAVAAVEAEQLEPPAFDSVMRAPPPLVRSALPKAAAARSPTVRHQPTKERVGLPPPALESVSETPTLVEEARLLRVAVVKLRKEHQPEDALSALDRYTQSYPHGELSAEAQGLRVEALLALDRWAQALELLDGLAPQALAQLPRSLEVSLLRAELKARSGGQEAAAIDAFDAVLAQTERPQLVERALFGRAVCQQRLGRREASRVDLQKYLELFPQGRFAQQAKRGL